MLNNTSSRTLLASGSSLIALFVAGTAAAQVDEIVVTATKQEENAQDIPVSVTALGEESLDELGVDVFTDYLVQLPGVTAGGSGPGQNTIYIRGLASTTPNLTVAGVAGLAPNVAFYLDEQPLAQPGRNLDVYAADLERVEVLPGPQGTLFGASSQAGTVRMITNKPVLGEFDAKAKFGTSFTEGGEMNNNVEAMVNLPVNEKLALRGVVFVDNQGGYIDNVRGLRNTSESARYREAGTIRDNGVPVAPRREGFQAGADLSDVNFENADNAALVEDDINKTVYSGFRLAGRYEFNPDWMLDVSHMRQAIESDGVFFQDPELGDLEIQRYQDDKLEDEFSNTSWTLQGRLAALDVLYTGAYTDRDTEQVIDYTDYMFAGQYFPVYTCDSTVSYPGAGSDPYGTCHAPTSNVTSTTDTTVESHEFRFTTPAEYRWQATAGVFYSKTELAERNDYNYLGSMDRVNADGSIGINALGIDQYPLTNGAETAGQIGNESQGYFSDPGPIRAPTIFRNDVLRTDEQVGFFGELSYDLVPDTFEVVLGARHYDIEVDIEGSANSVYDVLYPLTDDNGDPVDAQSYGTNISRLYGPNGPAEAPQNASTDGIIYKVTGNWTPTDDLLFFATYSEGFRPGLLNRPGGTNGPGDYVVPYELDTDEVKNYELGWKTQLFENQLQFNGSAFFVDIERLQTTIFDPAIVNLFYSDNAANAEIRGVEGDFTWAPSTIAGLTVAGGFSVLDTEITEVLTPTEDVQKGSPLAFAPEFQGNLRARYEWPVADYTAHVMPQIVHSAESYSDIIEINKAKLDSWTTLNVSAGLSQDQWTAELYLDNVTDERAQLSNDFVFDRERVTIMRPRTAGVRVTLRY